MNKLPPDRNKQNNFFICDITDTFKDDMASMEHPIFSLNKAIDTRVLRYERNNVVIEVSPSVKGLATIYDKDILLYLASALVIIIFWISFSKVNLISSIFQQQQLLAQILIQTADFPIMIILYFWPQKGAIGRTDFFWSPPPRKYPKSPD